MSDDELKNVAEKYRYLYRMNLCSREDAKDNILPYLDRVNELSQEIAKKFNQKPKTASFASYVR